MILKCSKCGNMNFEVIIQRACDNCKLNGVYDEETEQWIYPEETTEERTEVETHISCLAESCHGNGCHLYKCSKCNVAYHNIPFGR